MFDRDNVDWYTGSEEVFFKELTKEEWMGRGCMAEELEIYFLFYGSAVEVFL